MVGFISLPQYFLSTYVLGTGVMEGNKTEMPVLLEFTVSLETLYIKEKHCTVYRKAMRAVSQLNQEWKVVREDLSG